MATPRRIEWLGTYFVPNNERKGEIARLLIEDGMYTASMGGPLAEQADPEALRDVLDIACGIGDWALEVAARYPAISLVGIDINQEIINLARARAATKKGRRRVTFQVMDALDGLAFADKSFDLVNMRLGSTFLRIWDWPVLLNEILRVLRPGGIVRLSEIEIAQQSSSQAHADWFELLLIAEFHAGRLFERTGSGLTARLPGLLRHFGVRQVQSKIYPCVFESGTLSGETYYNYVLHSHTLLPFLQKWGAAQQDVETIYRQTLADIQQSAFRASWNIHTVWGNKA